jgi:hypothetical protein
MKNVKFYPKRIIIVVCMVLAIPLATLIAKVADIHIPNKEEIGMMENNNYNGEYIPPPQPEENIVIPDSNLPELTEEEIEFDNERTYDGCNGTPDKEEEIKNDKN